MGKVQAWTNRNFQPKNLLWDLASLKVYSTQNSLKAGISGKTVEKQVFRRWVWEAVKAIANQADKNCKYDGWFHRVVLSEDNIE
jgi:hypothetical protein